MTNRALLRRVDRHLDNADARWASIDEEIRLTREEVRLTREEVHLSREQRERHAGMFADVRVFTRDMMTRMERVTQQHSQEMREVSEALREMTHEYGAAMRDLRQESAAHREALLRVLDRLDPGDSPSPS
ncbi:MAG: hypothetical protein ACR2GL_04445 [Thermoleophilaceae bacterium]